MLSDLAMAFATGLLGGAHCIGMCGGFVFLYSTRFESRPQALLHGLYNAGRISTYFMIGMLVDFKVWEKISRPMIFIVIGMLLYLITSSQISGIHGSKRWISLAGIALQPSELAKIAVVIFLARFLTSKEEVMHRFKDGLLSSLVMVGVVFLLVLLQPDYSTAAIILGISVAMVFAGGARLTHLLILGAAGIPALAVIMLSSSYRMARVAAFLKPGENTASSYQATQALISLGNGGITGTGLGTDRG